MRFAFSSVTSSKSSIDSGLWLGGSISSEGNGQRRRMGVGVWRAGARLKCRGLRPKIADVNGATYNLVEILGWGIACLRSNRLRCICARARRSVGNASTAGRG